MGMYHINQTDTSRTVAAMSIDSITVRGLKYDATSKKYLYMDSVLYNNLKTITKIDLPLHSFDSVSAFEVTFNSKKITANKLTNKNDTILYLNKRDTLIVKHQNTDKYLSLQCGSIKVHSVDTVLTTNNFIDSIRITNRNVNNINVENIKIYK